MSALTRKRLMIALAVSLGANLFMAGFLVARGLRSGDGRRPVAAMESPRALAQAARSAGAGKQLRRVMQAHRPELRSRREAMREAHRRARHALVAQPFDPKALDAALDDVRSRQAERQDALHGAVVGLASELSPKQRRALAKASRRGGGKRPRPDRR